MKHLFLSFATTVVALGSWSQCDCPPLASRTEVIVTDAGQGTGTTTWTCDNTYILDGYVFVNAGQTLTIEPGTVIKGAAGAGADASAFIVANGGQVLADANESCPIIFTFQADPLDGSVAYDTRGQWGGVILLGDAATNFGGVAQIEGIPADNDRASYGGSNDAHSAGTLRYVSIRHGGTQLAAANEINGLTLGGVGSGTTLDHIEVVSNLDDGIEFFGGTASITNALVAFCGDDSFDWDQGYRGANNANWLAIQDQQGAVGDRGGELDGDDSDDGNVSANEQPFATPTVTGWTIVGVGGGQGLLFRNGSGGNVSNGLICNVLEGIEIEHKADEVEDAWDRWVAGDLTLSNIKVLGSTDALDYDGAIVADGDAQLDAYALANGVVLDAGAEVDYNFAFDASGQMAIDPLNVETTNGSGQSFALNWTFCDERGLFAQNSNLTCDCPPLSSRPEVVITDAGQGTGTTTWTCDNTYILDGYVFVNAGQTLTIEPGTVIKGAAGAGADASAFIVANGGQVIAEALAECPIIFTFQADPLDGSVAYDTRGQWGGVILLGDATTNFGGVAQIEGIPADNDRASYGGSNDAHSAGILRYVSIRHGGTQLAAANEINGLTLGGVGSGTTLDHIEVVSNLDDGIEFFGGTASITNALVAFCGDDSFDWDQGYRGANNANWLAIQDVPNAIGDRGGELDGDDSDDGNVSANEQPYATPTVNGWTVVSAGGQGLLFRNGSGGNVANGLLCGVSEGIEIEHKADEVEDAWDRWIAGDLTLSNIKVVGATDALDYDGAIVADGDAQLDAYANANGVVVDAGADIDYTFEFDGAGQLATDQLYLNGANGSGHGFALGWTLCDERGMFAATLEDAQAVSCDCPPLASRTEVVVTDAGQGTGTTTWTCDNTYILDGYVFVNAGQTLTINPGTVIKGAAGAGADASAFIVANGGQILADATESCPIIFTFQADPLDGSVAYDTRGQWGGVILLGDATTNFGGVAQIEGIPADNDRASYGGSNDAHSAGILRYVSIRHGGTQLAAANEINGLTLGGVGSGTTLDHIEVVSNLDDGIEFFGGTASITNALVAFCGDDSFDWDQGYRGANNANWLAIQDVPNAIGDRGGELDGDDSDDGNVSANEQPYATPTVNGWTVVSAGGQGLLFRNGSGGNVANGLLCGVSEGIEIEHKADEVEDAFDRWVAGDLTLSNIKVVGATDALDYDGAIVADGDAQLDAYALANGVVVDAGADIDYNFAFDAAGQLAIDKLFLNGSNGSGHTFALGWTFCDQREMFADNLNGAAGIPGCTDATACNYDAGATEDDGSCTYAEQYYDCNGACLNDADGDGVCDELEVAGCTDTNACNYDETATDDDGSCAQLDQCGVCGGDDSSCSGCTDPAFVEFDPYATIDDGSCGNLLVLGCTYENATNFNPLANDDDASCVFDTVVANDCPADLDGDGSVATSDLLEFLTAFGTVCQ